MPPKKNDPTNKVLREVRKQTLNPIAVSGTEGMILPNHSGDHSAGRVLRTPSNDKDIVNKEYVDSQASVTVSDTASIDLTLAGNNISGVVLPAGVDHDSLLNFVANEHIDWTQSGAGTIHATNYVDNDTTYTAGDGLDLAGTTFSTDLKTNGGLVIESTELAVDLSASSISGTLGIGDGGTGQTTQTAAFDALAPTTTKGDIIVFNGSDNIRLPIGTDGQVLEADSAEASGVKWATAAGASSEWTDTGTFLHPTDNSGGEDVGIGGTTTGAADILLNANGSAIFNQQGGATGDFEVRTDTMNSAIHVDYANEVLGLFTDPATAGMAGSVSVGGIPAQTTRYVLGVNDAFDSTSGTQSGSTYSLNANPSSASTAATYGIFLEAGTTAGNTQNITNNEGLIGAKIKINHRGSGTISQSSTLLVSNTSVTGTIGTHYGLFMDRQNRAGITTTWGIYQFHADDPNHFNGTMSLGSTTQGEQLLVEGAIQLDEKSDPSGTSGYGKIYTGTDTRFKFMDGTGNRTVPTVVIDSNVTAVGNVGAGEDDLMTHSVDVTNHMGQNGDSLTIYASGKFNGSTPPTLKAHWGSTTIFTENSVTSSEWFAEIRICRIGQSDQVIHWTLYDTGGNISTNGGVTAATENLSSDKTFKFTGEQGMMGGDDDITQEYMTIIHNPTQL